MRGTLPNERSIQILRAGGGKPQNAFDQIKLIYLAGLPISKVNVLVQWKSAPA